MGSCAVTAVPAQEQYPSWIRPTALYAQLPITKHFMELNQQGKVQVEYVWMDSDYWDGMSFDLCSKTLTVDKVPQSTEDLPLFNYGGEGGLDVKLVPKRLYRDPFRPGDNRMVLAETCLEAAAGTKEKFGGPTEYNTRAECAEIMQSALTIGEDPWFGIEQEYYLTDIRTNRPLGWPDVTSRPSPNEYYYCQVGAQKAVGRDVVEAHYRACLYAGVKIGGLNSEDEPGMWEYQVGPCLGMEGPDDLWMSRYILQKICEMYHVGCSFNPKPVPGRAGVGCHTNYSTKSTRNAPGGYNCMVKQIERLRFRHFEHMDVYGINNETRLTGQEYTMSMNDFSYGVNDRYVSVRINQKCVTEDCGYYEDRRPAGNMDPYLVCGAIVETTLLFEQACRKPRAKPIPVPPLPSWADGCIPCIPEAAEAANVAKAEPTKAPDGSFAFQAEIKPADAAAGTAKPAQAPAAPAAAPAAAAPAPAAPAPAAPANAAT